MLIALNEYDIESIPFSLNNRALSFYKINKCIYEKELFNNFTYIQILSIILNLLVIRNISNRYSCIKLFGIYEAYNYLVYMSNSYDYIDAYNSTAEELSKCEATKSSMMNDYNWYVEFYYDSVCSLETPPEECASGVYE